MTKAVTLHQPWATLVALGVKTIETRSWAAPKSLIGQRLLIHAGVRKPDYGPLGDEWAVCSTPGFPLPGSSGVVLARVKVPGRTGYCEMPLGAIVASCTLADCVPMVERWPQARQLDAGILLWGDGSLTRYTDGARDAIDVSDQRPYGVFAPGRWAWLLEDVKSTTERCPECWGSGKDDTSDCEVCLGWGGCDPIPAKGHQRVWEWTGG